MSEEAKTEAPVGSVVVLGERVKEARKALGKTQMEMASVAGMTQQEWNRIERPGRHAVELATAVDVASALGVGVDAISEGEAEEVEP